METGEPKVVQEEVTKPLNSDDSSAIQDFFTPSAPTSIPNIRITTEPVVPTDDNRFLVGMEHLLTKEELRSFQELYKAQNYSYNNLPYQAWLVMKRGILAQTQEAALDQVI